MTSSELIKWIRKFCKENANAAIVKKYQRFFKEGYDAYGLDVKTYEAGIKGLMDSGVTLKLILEAAPELIKSGKYEETSFTLSLVRRLDSEYSLSTFAQLGACRYAGWRNCPPLHSERHHSSCGS
jgi:hypothetical protein